MFSLSTETLSEVKLSDGDTAEVDTGDYYCSLDIPLSQVVFVDDECGLKACWKAIKKVELR